MNCNWGAIANYTWGGVDDYTWGNLTICQKVKVLSSSAALSSAIPRSTTRTLAAVAMVSAEVARQLIKTVIQKTLSAAGTVSGVVVRTIAKRSIANLATVSAVQKSTTQTLLGFVQASASHAKAVGKGLVSNVILTALKSADISKALSATANASSTIARVITHILSAAVNASATARRAITQVLSATVNTANAVLQRTARSFTATVNTVSSLARQQFKTLVATVNTVSAVVRQTANLLWEKTLTASVFVVYDVLPKTWGDLYASTWNDLTAYTWGDFLVQGGTHIKRRTDKNNLSASAQTVSNLSRFPLKVIVATVSIAATLAYIFGRRLVDKTTYVVVHSFRVVLSAVKAGARALFATRDMKLAISAVKSAPYRLYCTHTFRLEVNWRMGADPRGENIRMVLGETKIIELFVQDEDGAAADLTGATAIFAVEGDSADKACVVDGNKITVTIGASDISKVGTFGYEFRIRDALLQVDSLVKGKIFVDPKLTTTF